MPLESAGVWFDDGPGTAPRQQAQPRRRSLHSAPPDQAIVSTFFEVDRYQWPASGVSYRPALQVIRRSLLSFPVETDIEPDIAEESLWQTRGVSHHRQPRRPIPRRNVDSHYPPITPDEPPTPVTWIAQSRGYQPRPERFRQTRDSSLPADFALWGVFEFSTLLNRSTGSRPYPKSPIQPVASFIDNAPPFPDTRDALIFPALLVHNQAPPRQPRAGRASVVSHQSELQTPIGTGPPVAVEVSMIWQGQSPGYLRRPERARQSQDSSLPMQFDFWWAPFEVPSIQGQITRPTIHARATDSRSYFPFTWFELGGWGEWQGQSVRPIASERPARESRTSQEAPPLEDAIVQVLYCQVTQRPIPAPRGGQTQQLFAAPSWIEAGILVVSGPYCVVAGEIYLAGTVTGQVSCE